VDVGVPGARVLLDGPDGRKLDVELSGPDDGRPLIFHTGTPGGGIVSAAIAAAGADRGVRHIAYARPGYSRSDRQAGRTVGDCAKDVAAIADALGIERFLSVGWSGGGPHALACAALLGERTIATAALASVAPWDAPGLDWLAGMGAENIEEFAAVEAGEAQLHAFLEGEASELLSAGPAEIKAAFGDLLSEVDREALSIEFAEYFSASSRRGLANGVWGWLDDDVASVLGWGFDVRAIATPVSIWQGAEDRMVPFAHGQWLAANVAGARSHLLPGEGHISLVADSYPRVLEDLLALAG
jgi:pimeloyl-ACP methyl ester carboxylesterase